MNATSLCPGVEQLRCFSLGLVNDEEAASLEQHLCTCKCCLNLLGTLSRVSDELVDTIRTNLVIEEYQNDTKLTGLIVQVRAMYPTAQSAVDPLSVLAAAENQDELGRLAHFRILKVLGSGGMGVVFEAEDTQLQRRVALKILHPKLFGNIDCCDRFMREARAIAAIDHPHIATIFEVGISEGVPYYAMQLLHGETLEQRIQRSGLLPVDEVIRIGAEIAEALAATHSRGLIHRDVKPSNIMLDKKTSSVKLLDFGLVRPVADDTPLTHSGTLLGSPQYMAPEQAGGKQVDARADLFSLGSVLYAMCTGMPPFSGSNALAVIRSVCDDTPTPPEAAIPECLKVLIMSLLEKQPELRYQTASEVVDRLRSSDFDVPAPVQFACTPEPSATSHGRLPGRMVRLRGLAAAVVLLSLIGVGLTETYGITDFRHAFGTMGTVVTQQTHALKQVPVIERAKKPARKKTTKAVNPPVPVYPIALLPFHERGSETLGLGVKTADLLFAWLAMQPNLYLVDRTELNHLLQEQELNLSGAVNTDAATRIGQLSGAKVFVTGSVFEVDMNLHLVAKITGTETSRMFGASVRGKKTDDLAVLVHQLAEKIEDVIKQKANLLAAQPMPETDQIAQLRDQLADAQRPILHVHIEERHVGTPASDPAAHTAFIHLCKETGFKVLDTKASLSGADIVIKGEGFSELATQRGKLISVLARVEVKAVDRKTDLIVAVDRQTTVAVDLAEHLAAKRALEEATAILAARMLPKLVKR